MQFWCRTQPSALYTFGAVVWFLKPLRMRQVAGKPICSGNHGVARTGHIGSSRSISGLTRCVVVGRHNMALGRFDDGLVREQDRDAVANRVRSAALAALQGLPLILQDERFLADWADQDVEEVLGNHERGFYAFCPRWHQALEILTAKSFQPSALSPSALTGELMAES